MEDEALSAGACPSCGGVERRALAPGYFECVSRVVGAIVPPGVGGNPTPGPAPIYRNCGFRYQEGTTERNAGVCDCGILAIGFCSECGASRCGAHARLDEHDRFTCNLHIEERVTAEREAERNHERERILVAREAVASEANAIAEHLPWFPKGPTTTPGELAVALGAHAADARRAFRGIQKSFGRHETLRGWSFRMPKAGDSSRFLVVSETGRACLVDTDGSPPDSMYPGFGVNEIDEPMFAQIARELAAERGIELGPEPGMVTRDLVKRSGRWR